MAIYKVQGPNGEIITIEGPDGADPNDVIAQAQSLYKPKEKTATDYAKDFGKATASLADTGINAVTGMLDYAAYPLARAFGRTPEQATQETSSPKDVIGRAFGITQDPAYQSETSRRMMAGLGEGVEKYAVKPLTSATGLPEQDVSSMVNTAMLGAGVKAQPYINRAGKAVAQGIYNAEPYVTGAAKTAVTAPYQFGKGVIEGLVNKEYNPATSAMVPLRDTYTPPAAAQRFMGQLQTPPYKIGEGPSSGPLPNVPEQSLAQLQSQARPTSELVGGTAGRVAQAISPKTLAGETLVPLQGQGMQAFGERVGRGVRTNPLQAMGEVGLTALTGIPFKTLAQGIGEAGASYLGAKTGFMPGFSQKLGQAQKTAAQQQAFTPPPSSGGYTPPPGGYGGPPPPPGGGNRPISPSQIPPVTPAEISKQAALQRVQGQMSQQQGLTNPVSADFMSTIRQTRPQYQTPKEASMQAAASKLQSQLSPAGQSILDQIRARGNNPPVPTTPVSGPVSPASIQSSIDALPSDRFSLADKLALKRAQMAETPPPVISAVDEASMAKQAIESQKATNSEIISQHAKGNIMGETTSIDTGKDAYNGSNATQGKAKALEKAGVDSLPIVNGMTDAQVIDALHTEMFGKKTKSPFTPEARNPPSITTIRKGQERLRRELEPIQKLEEEIQSLEPVKSKIIDAKLSEIDEKMTALREDALENGLKPNSPEGQAYSEQMDKLYNKAKILQKELESALKAEEAALKAEKKASKSAPKTLEEKVDIVKTQGEARRNQARGKPNVLEMKIDDTGSKDFMTPTTDSIGTKIYGSKDNPLSVEQYEKVKSWKSLQGFDEPHIIYSKDKNGVLKTEKIDPDEGVKVRVGTPEKPTTENTKKLLDDFNDVHSVYDDAEISIWSKNKNGKVQNDKVDMWEMSTQVYDDYAKNPNSHTTYRKYEWNDRESDFVWVEEKVVSGQPTEKTIYSPSGEYKTKDQGHEDKKYKTDAYEYPDWRPSNINEWPDIFK